jgi:hypothetical protein
MLLWLNVLHLCLRSRRCELCPLGRTGGQAVGRSGGRAVCTLHRPANLELQIPDLQLNKLHLRLQISCFCIEMSHLHMKTLHSQSKMPRLHIQTRHKQSQIRHFQLQTRHSQLFLPFSQLRKWHLQSRILEPTRISTFKWAGLKIRAGGLWRRG